MKYVLSIVAVVFFSVNAMAGNVDTFGIGSKATALGGAFAATADDVYAIYYNPAGLVNIKKTVVSAGISAISPTVSVKDYRVTGGVASVPASPSYEYLQSSKNFENNSEIIIAPHMGLAVPVNDTVVFGIAAYAPWGLETEWDENPAVNPGGYNTFSAYYAREVVSPSLAWKLTDSLSVGGGISLGRSRVGNDYISAQTGVVVKASMEDDFNYSFNAGILYSPTERLSAGITYRGRTETDFEGDLEIDGIGRVSTLEMPFDHPEQVQAGVRYLLGEHKTVSMEADMVWTSWSINQAQVETLTPEFHGTSEVIVPRNWEDTWQYKFGLDWAVSNTWNLRCGYYFDPSPIPDETMDFVWPDADKHTWSAGFGVNLGRVTIDAVAVYSKTLEDRKVNGESESLNGNYHMGPEYPASVSFDAEGHVWSAGVTVSYTL